MTAKFPVKISCDCRSILTHHQKDNSDSHWYLSQVNYIIWPTNVSDWVRILIMTRPWDICSHVNRLIYIGLYYKPFMSKAFRYGQCVTMGSHSFTCHPHTKHIGLYSPAARCSSCLPTKGWPGWVDLTTITVPRTHNRFAVAGPGVWNSLPIGLQRISSYRQFWRYLKKHLFGIWEITAQCDAWFSAIYKYSYLLTYNVA